MTTLNTAKKPRLLDKIRTAVNRQKIARLPQKRLQFYRKHATLVQKTLRNPLFQRFLRWMLKRENIDKHRVKDVQIRVVPFLKDNGNTLAGRCKKKGKMAKILIFPKKLESYRRLASQFGKKSVYLYIKHRARAALIHELLHLKYSRDEEKVQRLTEKYLKIFTSHTENPPNSQQHNVLRILFPN